MMCSDHVLFVDIDLGYSWTGFHLLAGAARMVQTPSTSRQIDLQVLFSWPEI